MMPHQHYVQSLISIKQLAEDGALVMPRFELLTNPQSYRAAVLRRDSQEDLAPMPQAALACVITEIYMRTLFL